MVLKRRLTGILRTIIGPIRERRAALSAKPDTIMDILRAGAERGRTNACTTHIQAMSAKLSAPNGAMRVTSRFGYTDKEFRMNIAASNPAAHRFVNAIPSA